MITFDQNLLQQIFDLLLTIWADSMGLLSFVLYMLRVIGVDQSTAVVRLYYIYTCIYIITTCQPEPVVYQPEVFIGGCLPTPCVKSYKVMWMSCARRMTIHGTNYIMIQLHVSKSAHSEVDIIDYV